MTTFAQLKQASDITPVTHVGQNTPQGYFEAQVKLLGIITVYLLEGELDSPTARIKGRIELGTVAKPLFLVYRGEHFKGGALLRATSSAEALELIVK